ncbi:MAG: ABC transporter ATP-binding protein, partial [Candidatus Methanomethylicia archaeon]
MLSPIVSIVDLTKKFNGLVAVNRLNLTIYRGEIFGFLGPNGAGKTTTIRMICGLIKPTSGSINVAGIDVVRNAEAVRSKIGYMAQSFCLYEDLTVEENLKFFSSIYGISGFERRKRVQELLELVKLERFRNVLAGNLSGGLKQRLALAVALVHSPELLILDEPTAGIDPPLRREFWHFFREINRNGVTVIITTHYMDESENCDRLGLMNQGVLVAVDTPLNLKRKAYGGDVVEVTVKGSRNALMEFQKLGSIISVSSQPNGLWSVRIAVKNSEEVLPIIPSFTGGAGLNLVGIRQIQVSMEDAFIRLV